MPALVGAQPLCRLDASEEQGPLDAADDVRHSDFDHCPSDADGADEEVHAVFLSREDMLDGGSYRGLCGVAARDIFGHRFALRLLAVNVRDETVPA